MTFSEKRNAFLMILMSPFGPKIHFWRPLLKMSPQIFPRDLVFDIYLLRSKEIIKSRPARAGSRARDPAGGGGVPPSPRTDIPDCIACL